MPPSPSRPRPGAPKRRTAPYPKRKAVWSTWPAPGPGTPDHHHLQLHFLPRASILCPLITLYHNTHIITPHSAAVPAAHGSMPDQFLFVPVSGAGRPKPADRALIRSRCMQGKNRQEGSRRSLQATRRAARKLTIVPEHEGAQPQTVPVSPSNKPPHAIVKVNRVNDTQRRETDVNRDDDLLAALNSFTLPPRPGPSDLKLIKFADHLDTPSQEVLFKLLTRSTLQTTFYPIEYCVDLPRSRDSQAKSIYWLLHDKHFLHSVIFSASAIQDTLMCRGPARTTQLHLRRTLSYLNNALFEKDSYQHDSTLFVVLTLALIAAYWGDFTALGVHLAGLQEIIRLRGGLKYLQKQPKMHYKIDCMLMAWALGTGGTPTFFTNGPVSWSPFFKVPRSIFHSSAGTECLTTIVDPRLAIVFRDLEELVYSVNEHNSRNSLLGGSLFQTCLESIQARLTQLQDQIQNSTDQCIHLGMLAFLSTTLQVPGKRFPYTYLAGRLRDAYQTLPASLSELKNVALWLLIVGAISVLEPDEPWLRSLWAEVVVSGLTWEEARKQLQGVMWIECIHEELGRAAFAKLTTEVQSMETSERSSSSTMDPSGTHPWIYPPKTES
ncbi:hypothetical protein G7046_g4130 [Stylonectria norvegica]|nr:hypothetical protein G7046_g4130 [Stylonectria norvegica]